jgi:hypothetical protein
MAFLSPNVHKDEMICPRFASGLPNLSNFAETTLLEYISPLFMENRKEVMSKITGWKRK